jgi:type I restriction-modification system DNA methylase subunit
MIFTSALSYAKIIVGNKKVQGALTVYQQRPEGRFEIWNDSKDSIELASRRVEMSEIADENDYNLNISRYVSTAVREPEIILKDTHGDLVEVEKAIVAATDKHNKFLKDLGLDLLPTGRTK